MKETFDFICRQFLITFFPERLNTLQITSHKYGIDKKKQQIQIQKLRKKMLTIATKYSDLELEEDTLSNPQNLFYVVYNRIDNLTEKELQVLQQFGKLLKEMNGYEIREQKEEIDKQIDLIRKRTY